MAAEHGRSAVLRPCQGAFRLLIALFAIADTLRRERYCVGGCGHEWHRPAACEDAGPAPT
ncbi:DUF5958 family protein [Streptomyces sp. NPDC059697]|uniref:DUF5958 family protein n=1 Tax=Streptomyces sp. NPDC059697 TaxID=3346912 RepID=UPI0036C5ADA8